MKANVRAPRFHHTQQRSHPRLQLQFLLPPVTQITSNLPITPVLSRSSTPSASPEFAIHPNAKNNSTRVVPCLTNVAASSIPIPAYTPGAFTSPGTVTPPHTITPSPTTHKPHAPTPTAAIPSASTSVLTSLAALPPPLPSNFPASARSPSASRSHIYLRDILPPQWPQRGSASSTAESTPPCARSQFNTSRRSSSKSPRPCPHASPSKYRPAKTATPYHACS